MVGNRLNNFKGKNLTFRADLSTTTSQGLCTHGSPSTWTGMSEWRWILMLPPYQKKKLLIQKLE
jgi:hypothetical protein